jgi:HSP20 family protein
LKERNHLLSASDKTPLLEELKNMKQRMDTIYSHCFETAGTDISSEPLDDSDSWQPAVDIWETPEEWLLVADLPGVLDDDLQVELDDNRLTLSGTRSVVPSRGGLEGFSSERLGGTFLRTFVLPSNVQRDSIQAECRRGVLTVTIPKDHRTKTSPHKVQVQME